MKDFEKYDKPFKTYEEMITIMENRNIVVSDKDFAKMVLQNFSYYGLVNGYKNTFLQDADSNLFIPGTKFEELYTLHIIDIGLNNILFKYIIFLEHSLKSRISYLISKKYGVYTDSSNIRHKDPSDYLSKVHYSNSNNKRSDILWKLNNCITTQRHNPSISHYIDEKNHIPAWILTTNIPYGLAIEWYSILKSDDKDIICSSIINQNLLSPDKAKEFLKKGLELTKEYRNKIAHGNRTFNIPNLPILPKQALMAYSFNTITEYEYNMHIGQNDITAVFLVIMIFIDDPYLLKNFIKECYDVLYPYNDVAFVGKSIYDLLGLPTDIFKRIDKLFSLRFT